MKNIDYFNKAIAEKKGLENDIVRKVNDFFWRKGVRKNLTDVNYRSLYIKHLGTITVSKYKLDKKIEHLIKRIRSVRVSPKFKEETKELILAKYYDSLKAMLKRRNEIALEYYNRDYEQTKRVPKTYT